MFAPSGPLLPRQWYSSTPSSLLLLLFRPTHVSGTRYVFMALASISVLDKHRVVLLLYCLVNNSVGLATS